MSLKALSVVWDESRACASDLLVLLALADWADPYGRCYPSLLQIARKARISRASVKRAIKRLIELGELERVVKGHAAAAGEDEDDGPVSIRSQARNAYRILLVRARRAAEVGSSGAPEVGSSAAPQVGSTGAHKVGSPRPHLENPDPESPKGGSPRPHPGSEGGLKCEPQVGSNALAHIRNKPSVEPSEELKAGAPPRPHGEIPENPDDNLGVITTLVHETLDIVGDGLDDAELREAVKDRIGVLNRRARTVNKIAYDSTVIGKAIDSARWQRRNRRRGIA